MKKIIIGASKLSATHFNPEKTQQLFGMTNHKDESLVFERRTRTSHFKTVTYELPQSV